MRKLLNFTLALVVCPALAGQQKPVVAAGSCSSTTHYEEEGYTIRSVRVEDPFSFLPWIGAKVRAAQTAVDGLRGKPFRMNDVTSPLHSGEFLSAPSEQRVQLDLIVVSLENCDNKQVDVVYWVLSSQISPALSATFEAGAKEKTTPESSAGVDAAGSRLQIFPAAGYDATDRFFVGGTLDYKPAKGRSGLINHLGVAGLGSTSMHTVSASLSGSRDANDWLAHAQWQLDYANRSEPATAFLLSQGRLAGQFSGLTRPLGKLQAPVRFGASLEGGNLQSNVPAANLGHDTLASSGYGSVKMFAGTSWRSLNHRLSASYGAEIGSSNANFSVSWVKQIVDLADDWTLPFGDHRSVGLESRFTGGWIELPGAIPEAARFFGGNREFSFIPGSDWVIRGNPFIRSIPANRLAQTGAGLGGTNFVCLNLTASVVTWRFPLVPSEVTSDPGFAKALDFQMNSATSIVRAGYLTKEEHFQAAAAQLDSVKSSLAALSNAVTEAQSAHPGQFTQLFAACTSAVKMASRRTQSALAASEGDKYGSVAALLSADPAEDRLHKVQQACVAGLNTELHDDNIATRAAALEAVHAEMERDFAAIDESAASAQADAEMKYVRTTMNTLMHQVNLFSISPVAIFDVAHLGPANSDLGTRYAVGGGVRAGLVSHVEFTLGYAANPKRLPGEGKGALFLGIQLKDVFE
jgi:hypothetical protein